VAFCFHFARNARVRDSNDTIFYVSKRTETKAMGPMRNGTEVRERHF